MPSPSQCYLDLRSGREMYLEMLAGRTLYRRGKGTVPQLSKMPSHVDTVREEIKSSSAGCSESGSFVVAQVGARRNYAVPTILASAGMLERFFTDICGNVGLGRALSRGGFLLSSAARLSARCVPAPVISRTTTFPIRTLAHICHMGLVDSEPQSRFHAQIKWQRSMGRAAARESFGKATHFFSMLGEFPPLLFAARERGLAVVTEIYTLLSLENILDEERKQFPSWEPGDHDLGIVRRAFPTEQKMLSVSNYFLCPSESVRNDLVLNHNVALSSTTVIPYGVHPRWLELDPMPEPRRILSVGHAGLGKGTHYLGMAAEMLARRGESCHFRVAGNAPASVTSQQICRKLTFLGRVDRSKIHQEFQAADLFVLPTLAEGSAEVTYEALASGVPVITTKAAGSVVRDGIEGRIVPERDPVALALAIQELTEDRLLRDRMAVAARERAKDYTWDRYGDRLLTYLRSLSI
jgi:glycosyltransferase involved in cell wall biosynthesis